MIKQNKFGDFGKQYIIGIYMTVTTGKTLTSRHQWKIHMFYNIGYLHIFICKGYTNKQTTKYSSNDGEEFSL